MIELQPQALLDSSSDVAHYREVIGQVLRSVVRSLKLQDLLIRNQVFDAANIEDFTAFSFHMWPGWSYQLYTPGVSTLLGSKAQKYYLSLRGLHQVIRLENVLEKLLIIREMSMD